MQISVSYVLLFGNVNRCIGVNFPLFQVVFAVLLIIQNKFCFASWIKTVPNHEPKSLYWTVNFLYCYTFNTKWKSQKVGKNTNMQLSMWWPISVWQVTNNLVLTAIFKPVFYQCPQGTFLKKWIPAWQRINYRYSGNKNRMERKLNFNPLSKSMTQTN